MKGSVLIAFSAVFFASYGVWSKLMVGTFGEFNQAIVKAVLLLAVILPYALLSGKFKRIEKSDIKWFLAIALAGGLNQAPYYFGFEHLPVGTATLLFYTALTLGAYILGVLFFREKITLTKAAAFIIALVGLLIIYQFQLTSGQLAAALSTVAAGFMGSIGVVLSKKLSGNYPELQIVTGYLVAMILVNPVLSFLAGESLPQFNTLTPWFAQLGYAVSYLIANLAVVAGFKYLDPSIGALIGLSEVVFAAIFGIILFSEVMTLQLIIGSGLILIAMSLPDLTGLITKTTKAAINN